MFLLTQMAKDHMILDNMNFSFKKTKIVATIGPATESEETLTSLVKAGMNVTRLNFSHGDHAEHQKRVITIRKVSKNLDIPVAILQDLSGPKIRIGDFGSGQITLKKDALFTLTTKKISGDESIAYVNYPNLPKEVKVGNFILVDDGKKKLQIIKTSKDEVLTKVIVGGEIKSRRGINLPGSYLKISAITPKDEIDLKFGIKNKVDFVALSFVREAADVLKLRAMLKAGKSDAHIIAKIETAEAIENLDEIINAADGIMVARGDLAIEIPAPDVPLIQKEIIEKCNSVGKPVITATQMLESMVRSPVPTRAEVSDVANSILDGSDAVMLSEETAIGQFPVLAVEMMSQIAGRVEEKLKSKEFSSNLGQTLQSVSSVIKDMPDAISYSATRVATRVGAKAIVALTESGFTARMLSRFKPHEPIIVMTPHERTKTKLALSFGCLPVKIKGFKDMHDVTKLVSEFVKEKNIAKSGDKVVIVAGMPFGKTGGTNTIMVHTI